MTQPPSPLHPEQQRQLVAQIGQAVAAAVPVGWRELRVEYRAVGRHVEADVAVVGPDGSVRPVAVPSGAVELLGRLRAGMYHPGRGTWLAATFVFDPTAAPHADYVADQEPSWRRTPPPRGFQDELRFFPRADRFIPMWFRARAGMPPVPQAQAEHPTPVPATSLPDEAGHDLRMPRVYDGLDESGRPVVDRPALAPGERERVLDYLTTAPVVLAARSHGTDAFDPGRPPSVPLTFRTDGAWVWPGAVAYYLREHDVPPDPDLVSHLRARNFVVPDLPESALDRAVATITGSPS